MAKKRDPLGLSPHWHVDCRLEAELPEDNVVRTRFLVNTLFGSAALVSVVSAGWLAYRSISLTNGIRDWEQRIAEAQADVQEVRQDQQSFNIEAAKIERAASLIKTPYLVSELTANLGRTLPPSISISSIESIENGILVGGIAPSGSQVKDYVETLKKDPAFSSLFVEIKEKSFERSRSDPGLYAFEVTLRLPAPNP